MTFRRDFEHRDALLGAAIAEFSEHGYDSASINRILSVAGVSKGQLYHHFGSKEGLYLALVEWMIDSRTSWMERHPIDVPDDLVAAIGAHMRASFAFAATHPDVARLSRALVAERGRPIFATVVARFGFGDDGTLADLIDRFASSGAIRQELSPAFVRRAVTVVVNHLPELLDLGAPVDIDDRIEELLAFLRGGLLSDP